MKWTEKTVGRRNLPWRVSPEDAAAWQDEVARWNRGHVLCDKGVFRFRTFEEADRWMMDQMATKARERRLDVEAIAERLNRAGCRYAVIGGFAMQHLVSPDRRRTSTC